jgi:aldehyde:ferredoxin oxidoreductase
MKGGYFGRMLRIDLSTRKMAEEVISDDFALKFLGGSGFAAHYVFNEINPDVDPLSRENKLIFAAGPFCGTSFPAGNRYAVASKSPLTGIWGHATASGFWGPELRFTGHDGIIIEGRADSPVYLYVTGNEKRILDARHLWGKMTSETQEIIRSDLGDKKVRVACIGPAGENLVRYACIINDKGCAAGRTGMGAVMGSKNLKAIAVRGDKRVPVASAKFNEDALNTFKAIREDALSSTPTATAFFHNYGTAAIIPVADSFGSLAIKNYSLGKWKDLRRVDLEALRKVTTSVEYCYNCPLGCRRAVTIKEGPYAVGENVRGPEYETVGSFGTMCLLASIEAVCKCNQLCDEYGLDTMSCGSTIAFAMECYERGIISKITTGGIELTWGNADTIIEMIAKIAMRSGFGAILAEGSRAAARSIGKEAEGMTTTVKGLEAAMHDPRAEVALALQYAVVNRGACHLHSRAEDICLYWAASYPEVTEYKKGTSHFIYEGKPKVVAIGQDIAEIANGLGICHHPMTSPSDKWPQPVLTTLAKHYTLLTGHETSVGDLMGAGERITNLERSFNILCGIRRTDDRLPKKFMEPKKEGAVAGRTSDVERMLDEYYNYRGWNPNGIPTREKLMDLGMEDVAERVANLR